jgi:hypothetical protein
MLTVTPGGFANSVTFSCSPISGITCAFSLATVTPANGAVSTTLTVTTSASVSRYGLLMPDLLGPYALLIALALFRFATWRARRVLIECFTADRRSSGNCCAGARDRRLRGIRQQYTAKPGRHFNHGHRPVWSCFSRHNRQGHSAVIRKERR